MATNAIKTYLDILFIYLPLNEGDIMQYYAIDEICFKNSIPYSLILLSGTDKFLYRANARYSICLHFLVCYRSDDIQCFNANFFFKVDCQNK